MLPCWSLLLLCSLLPTAYSAPHSAVRKTASIIFIGDASLMEEALTERLVECLAHADSVRRKNIVGHGYNYDTRMQGRINSKHTYSNNYFEEVPDLHVVSENKLPSGLANNMYSRTMPWSSYDHAGASMNSAGFRSRVSSGHYHGMGPTENGGSFGIMSSNVHNDVPLHVFGGVLGRKHKDGVSVASWADLAKHAQHSSSRGITGAWKKDNSDSFPFAKNVNVFDAGFREGSLDMEHTDTLVRDKGSKISLLSRIIAAGKTDELLEHLSEVAKNCKESCGTDSPGMRRDESDYFGGTLDHNTGRKGNGLLAGLLDTVGLLGGILSGLLGGGNGDGTLGAVKEGISDEGFIDNSIKGGRFFVGENDVFLGSLDGRTGGNYENMFGNANGAFNEGDRMRGNLFNGYADDLPSDEVSPSLKEMLNDGGMDKGDSWLGDQLDGKHGNILEGIKGNGFLTTLPSDNMVGPLLEDIAGDEGTYLVRVPSNVPVGGHQIYEDGSLTGGAIRGRNRASMFVGGYGHENSGGLSGSKVNGMHGSFDGFVGGTVDDDITGATSGGLLGGSIIGSLLDGGLIGSTSGGLVNGILKGVLGKDGMLKSIVGIGGLAGDLLDAILGKLLSLGGLTSILGNNGHLGMIEGVGLKITHLDMPAISVEMLQQLGLKLSLDTKVHVSADSLMGDVLDCAVNVNLMATAQLTSDRDGSPRLIVQHCDSMVRNLDVKLSNGAFDGLGDSIRNLLNIALPAVVCPIADVLMGLVSAGLSSVNTVAPLGEDGSLQYTACSLPVISEDNFEIDLNTVVQKDTASSLPVIEVNRAMQLPPKQQGTSQLAIHHDFLTNAVNLLLTTMDLQIDITEKDDAKLSSSLLSKLIPMVESFYPTPEDMMVQIKMSAAPTLVFENKKPIIKVSARTEFFVASPVGPPHSLFSLDTNISFRVMLIPGDHHLKMSVSPKSVTMKDLTSNIGDFELEPLRQFVAEMVRHGAVGPMNVALKEGIALPHLFNLNFANADISYLEDNIVLTVPTPHVGQDCHSEQDPPS